MKSPMRRLECTQILPPAANSTQILTVVESLTSGEDSGSTAHGRSPRGALNRPKKSTGSNEPAAGRRSFAMSNSAPVLGVASNAEFIRDRDETALSPALTVSGADG